MPLARLALLLTLLVLGGCRDRHEWHQKTTVTVETPAGERSGAAVVGVVAWFGQLPASGNEVEYRITGEATVVEVAPGRYLFALLGGSQERFYAAARDRFRGMPRKDWLREIPRQAVPVELTGGSIPLLVTFDDVADPKTVRRVDPADLAATFGPGFALKSVTLEVTREPVTEGRVEATLGWLEKVGRVRGTLIPDPPRLSTDLSDPPIQLLAPSAFSTELYK